MSGVMELSKYLPPRCFSIALSSIFKGAAQNLSQFILFEEVSSYNIQSRGETNSDLLFK